MGAAIHQNGTYNPLVFKIGLGGELLWNRTYLDDWGELGAVWGLCSAVARTRDGGYLVTGTGSLADSIAAERGLGDVFAMKLDEESVDTVSPLSLSSRRVCSCCCRFPRNR